MPILPVFQKSEALLTEIRSIPTDRNAFACWWLGQRSFLIKWAGKHLLLDPDLKDSPTKKYEQVVHPALLDFIDILAYSHHQIDHLDFETLMLLIKTNPNLNILLPAANRAFVAGQINCDTFWPIGIDAGQSRDIQGFKFWAIPGGGLNYVVQFGGFTIYHCGNAVLHDGMAELLRPFGVDVALLPINGNGSDRGVADNLGYKEAARLGKAIGAQYIVACHDMLKPDTADVKAFELEARKIEQAVRVMQLGEGVRFRS